MSHHASYSLTNYRHFEIFTNKNLPPMLSAISSTTSFSHFLTKIIPIDSARLHKQFSFSQPYLTPASTQQFHSHSNQSLTNPASHSHHPKRILTHHSQTNSSFPFHYLQINTTTLTPCRFHYYFNKPTSTPNQSPQPIHIHTCAYQSTNTHTNPVISILTTHSNLQ